MEKFKRSLLFWTLVLVFIIVAPTLVLYSTGYRFDWKKGIFVHSGTITFKSNPQNIRTTLNGVNKESNRINRINRSFNLTGLLPGNYDLEISAPEFNSWSKKVYVHSGLATEFWNIILTRKNYEKIPISGTENAQRFYLSPENRLIAFSDNSLKNLKIEIVSMENSNSKKTFFIPEKKLISEDEKENIEWSPKEEFISVPTFSKNNLENGLAENSENIENNVYFSIEIKTGKIININDFFQKASIKNVRWDPEEKGALFFLSENNLYGGNINNSATLKVIAEDVSAYDLSKTKIYFTKTPENIVFSKNIRNISEQQQITNYFPEESKKIKRLVVYDENRISFLEENKKLFVFNRGENNEYFKKIGSGVEGTHFSDDGKKLLFWTNNEISVYYMKNWLVQPIRNENELHNITRYSETLKNVQWFKDYEHIIFSSGKQTKIIELDSRDKRNCLDIISTDIENSFVIYDHAIEKLFFTDSSDNGKINYITFPENIPLLGLGG